MLISFISFLSAFIFYFIFFKVPFNEKNYFAPGISIILSMLISIIFSTVLLKYSFSYMGKLFFIFCLFYLIIVFIMKRINAKGILLFSANLIFSLVVVLNGFKFSILRIEIANILLNIAILFVFIYGFRYLKDRISYVFFYLLMICSLFIYALFIQFPLMHSVFLPTVFGFLIFLSVIENSKNNYVSDHMYYIGGFILFGLSTFTTQVIKTPVIFLPHLYMLLIALYFFYRDYKNRRSSELERKLVFLIGIVIVITGFLLIS